MWSMCTIRFDYLVLFLDIVRITREMLRCSRILFFFFFSSFSLAIAIYSFFFFLFFFLQRFSDFFLSFFFFFLSLFTSPRRTVIKGRFKSFVLIAGQSIFLTWLISFYLPPFPSTFNISSNEMPSRPRSLLYSVCCFDPTSRFRTVWFITEKSSIRSYSRRRVDCNTFYRYCSRGTIYIYIYIYIYTSLFARKFFCETLRISPLEFSS